MQQPAGWRWKATHPAEQSRPLLRSCAGCSGGRDAKGLLPLLQLLRKHVCHPRHARLLTDVAHRVLDIYAVTVRFSLPLGSLAPCIGRPHAAAQ